MIRGMTLTAQGARDGRYFYSDSGTPGLLYRYAVWTAFAA